MNFLAILVVVLNLKISLSLYLDCSFKESRFYWETYKNYNTTNGTRYTCVVQSLTTSLLNRTLLNITGTHEAGKTHDDVKQVYVTGQHCPYLPLGLGKFFKNLEILYIKGLKVEQLTKDDLKDMSKLKILDLASNPITNLSRDFLQGHDSIEIISFNGCKLKFIEKGALDSLKNLKEGHFDNNICVNYRFEDRFQISELKEAIKKCLYDEPTTESGASTENDETTTECGAAIEKSSWIVLLIVITLTRCIWFLKSKAGAQ
jgi:hypothetical protein